jgi:hypothetical protein
MFGDVEQDIDIIRGDEVYTNFDGITTYTGSSHKIISRITDSFSFSGICYLLDEFGNLLYYTTDGTAHKYDFVQQIEFLIHNPNYTILVDIDGVAYVWDGKPCKLPDYITFTKKQQPAKSARK